MRMGKGEWGAKEVGQEEREREESETKKVGERWGSPRMSSAFEFEIGNRVAGHCSALQLVLSLSENVLSLPPAPPPPPLCSERCRWRSVRPQDIKKPRRPWGWECTLFSSTFAAIRQRARIHQRAMHAGLEYQSNGSGDELHDLHCFTPIMNMCWCTSIWEQMHTALPRVLTDKPALEARASAGNMQLCGYDVIDFLHWLEAARCRVIRERWKVPRCVEY